MSNPIINRNVEVNKLQGEYLSSNLNEVWTVDVTSIKQKYYFFFIMDLASRRIVYYDVSPRDYTATEATLILLKALQKEAGVKPERPVSFVHTDSGRIFLSKEWMECLEVNNVLPSSANSERNQNQVSERFNRTFKKLLRDKLNVMLNKKNNKTNTFQLIGEATKYNFENLLKLTEEIIVYYNSEKPHIHLNELPPDMWANQARQLPEQRYIFEEISNDLSLEVNPILEMPTEVLIDHIETIQSCGEDIIGYKDLKEKDSSEILNNMLDLQNKKIILFTPLSRNDNSEKAKKIREYKNNVGSLELIKHVKESKIDISKMDVLTREMYEKISNKTTSWQETDIKYLETIMLQNHIIKDLDIIN